MILYAKNDEKSYMCDLPEDILGYELLDELLKLMFCLGYTQQTINSSVIDLAEELKD